jgi:hyperosmotically inducible periplasmic protein
MYLYSRWQYQEARPTRTAAEIKQPVLRLTGDWAHRFVVFVTALIPHKGCPLPNFFSKKGTTEHRRRVSLVPLPGGTQNKKMKRLTLSLLCLSILTLPALAQDKPADNSARNERDRSGETKTSGDQSNSSEDIKITAAIRRAVMKDHSLTMTAKNVKIITSGGLVTLRGPVMSAEEKTKIDQLARAAAPGAKIDNQLEVKQSK